jgi:ribosomal protein S18 acetylase RimI-like enzyme
MLLALRPATADDERFLLGLRHATMDRHLIASGLTPSEEEHLRRVRIRFDCAEIVLVDGEPAGLLKVARESGRWDLIQIQFAPAFQGRGLGTRLLEDLVAEARGSGASLVLDVLKVNPARRLYERLGFVIVGENEHSFDMQLAPDAR